MPINDNEIVHVNLNREALLQCIENAKTILCSLQDRKDLHARDELERFEDLLMGEVAEQMVIHWLGDNGKKAVSAVDKASAAPDAGHDIWVQDNKGKQRKCSVKSSLSVHKTTPAEILDTYTLAVNEQEARDINVQVYFWLDTKSSPRVSVPSLRNAAIIAWCTRKDIARVNFQPYEGERRKSPAKKLRALRPPGDLLAHLS